MIFGKENLSSPLRPSSMRTSAKCLTPWTASGILAAPSLESREILARFSINFTMILRLYLIVNDSQNMRRIRSLILNTFRLQEVTLGVMRRYRCPDVIGAAVLPATSSSRNWVFATTSTFLNSCMRCALRREHRRPLHPDHHVIAAMGSGLDTLNRYPGKGMSAMLSVFHWARQVAAPTPPPSFTGASPSWSTPAPRIRQGCDSISSLDRRVGGDTYRGEEWRQRPGYRRERR